MQDTLNKDLKYLIPPSRQWNSTILLDIDMSEAITIMYT